MYRGMVWLRFADSALQATDPDAWEIGQAHGEPYCVHQASGQVSAGMHPLVLDFQKKFLICSMALSMGTRR